MVKYVALLRGINVGGNHKVEMTKLKNLFEGVSFKKVKTYINSGNIIFDSPEVNKNKLVLKIEDLLKKNFKFEIPVIVRSLADLKKIIKVTPSSFANDAEQRTDIIFLWDEFNSKKTLNLIKQTKDIDCLIYVDGAIVWQIKRKDYNQSSLHKFIGTTVYKNMTARNINTVRKLLELMEK